MSQTTALKESGSSKIVVDPLPPSDIARKYEGLDNAEMTEDALMLLSSSSHHPRTSALIVAGHKHGIPWPFNVSAMDEFLASEAVAGLNQGTFHVAKRRQEWQQIVIGARACAAENERSQIIRADL